MRGAKGESPQKYRAGGRAGRQERNGGEDEDFEKGAERLTGGGIFGVHALAHDRLEAHARAHAPERDERGRVCPRCVAERGRDARLPALPGGEGGGDGEEGLDEGAEHEPRAGGVAHVVAQPAEDGAGEEAGEGGECVLVCETEGEGDGAGLEEAGEGDGELDGVAGLEGGPDEDGGEGDCVSVWRGENG